MIKPLRNFIVLIVCLAAFTAHAVTINSVDTTTGGFVGMATQGPLDEPILVTSYAEFTSIFGATSTGLANPYLGPSVAGYFANGGINLIIIRVAAADDATMIGADGGWPGTRSGLQALLDVDEVSFVAMPGVTTGVVQDAMIAHCEAAGDRMAILDSDSPDDLAAVQVQRAALASDDGFAALYFPWIEAEPAGVSLILPPSGFVAGFYSALSAHNSPIGVIATATDLAYVMTDEEQDILNTVNINALRNLSGIRIWGARTLSTDPEWRYVAVRRSSNCIVESVTEGTLWCLDEYNDASLWFQLRGDVDNYLNGLWRDGWLAGSSPNDAFFVHCGLYETMTPTDVSEGRTIVEMGYSLVRPAEFLTERIVHQRGLVSGAGDVAKPRMIMVSAMPNPFNPSTAISIEVPDRGHVSVVIYDARGSVVRVLRDGVLEMGAHVLQWNGTNGQGVAMPSGVYLVRAMSDGEGMTTKLVLAR